LRDEKEKDIALFSGDTLFIGDVGRPDLAQKSKSGINRRLVAAQNYLYDSLHQKIMPLA
jgi:glyoxylase-like metal-dependent hydrolase (beta-lactamase superfamily II)